MKIERRLSEGIGGWLTYETHCNKAGLFSERYLSFPIGQILNSVYGSNVHSEYIHPVLKEFVSGRGAKPKIDFAVLDNEGFPTLAIESKWVGDSTPSVESILWDLVRLELLSRRFGTSCIFLIAGKRKRLEALFQSEDFTLSKTARREAILSTTSRALCHLNLVSTDPHLTELWRPILAKWKTLGFPSKIGTQLFNPFPKECTLEQHQVFGWRVNSPPNQTVFRPIKTKNHRG